MLIISGVLPNFAFNVRGRSVGRLQGTLINTFLTIQGPSSIDKGFFPVSFSMFKPQAGRFRGRFQVLLICMCLTSQGPCSVNKGFFSSFAFNGRSQWSSLRSFVRYAYIQMSDYLGTIQCLQGFFPVSLSVVEVVLGSFARYALHIHMYDYKGAIQC